MKNTNLPNNIINTIAQLRLAVASPSAPDSLALVESMATIRPGFWLLEKSSFSERRKEFGGFDSIVRLICYYQKTKYSDIIYCTENSAGELMNWSNCSFYSMVTFDWGWTKKEEIIDRNLEWAKQAVIRHEIAKDLEGEEKIFFDISEKLHRQ